MRLILMGTGPFAVPTFRSLLASEHDIAAIVTRPVEPVRSRRKDSVNPVRDLAMDQGALLLTPANVNDPEFHPELNRLAPELLVVCDFGQILSNQTLTISALGGINLHGSLLPKYRGAAPVNWAIWNGEQETGVTVIHMTPGLDAGPCLTAARTKIDPAEDAIQLERRLAELGVTAVWQALETLDRWDHRRPLGRSQDNQAATRAPRLKKSDGRIDWSRSARQLSDQVRAFKPWPASFTEWHNGKSNVRLILDQVAVESATDDLVAGQPGTVVRCDKEQLVVATGQGALRLERVQPAGKRSMAISEFLRGHRIQVGDRFGN